jgi:hypothetical protein
MSIESGLQLRYRHHEGRCEIFDLIRKKWVKLTEEEQVRQSFIIYLIQEKRISAAHISVEKQIKVNGMICRYDLIVFDSQGNPYMLAECKAPHVELTQEVLDQAGKYNQILKAPFIAVTNGKEHRIFKTEIVR